MKNEKIEKLINLVDRIIITRQNEDEVQEIKEFIDNEEYVKAVKLLQTMQQDGNIELKDENDFSNDEDMIDNKNEKYYMNKQNNEENEGYYEDNKDSEEDEEDYEDNQDSKEDDANDYIDEYDNVEYEESYENNEIEDEDNEYLEDDNIKENETYTYTEDINEENNNIYPQELSSIKLEEEYISLLLANPKAISMYYILKKDCYFISDILLNIYKSILFTEGQEYSPQIAKDHFNFAKDDEETYQEKIRLKEIGLSSNTNLEKVYIELRKLFEIRKKYMENPIQETKKKIADIINYKLYNKMTIEDTKSAIEQITATEKFKRSILNNDITDFLISGENNLTQGLQLPFPILSSVFKGIRKGETMAYAMPSNSGKSRFTINLAANLAFIHNKKVLIISNEMSEEKMKLCLITTILNDKKIQKIHGKRLSKTEGELLEFKFRPDRTAKGVKLDKNGFILKEQNETQKDFAKRLRNISSEFRNTIEVTKWAQEQVKNSIYFVNITNHTNDELEKVILNYYYKEKIEYIFYDTLKTDTENIGNGEEIKKTATILSNLAQNLNIFIASSLQLSETTTLPINLNINDLAVSRTVKEVLDTLYLVKQIHSEDYDKYEYSKKEVDTKFFNIERSKNPDVRYYACVVDKNRAGAKPKVLFKLNLAYNIWEELGYLRMKS